MSNQRIASFMQAIEMWESTVDPNGTVTPIAIGAMCVVNTAGIVNFWLCTALPSTWVNVSGGGTGVPISSLLAATAVNSINSGAFAQTWSWDSLTTQTALTVASSSMTTGHLLDLTSTNAAATGKLLSVTSSTTGLYAQAGVDLSSAGVHTGVWARVLSGTATGTGLAVQVDGLSTGDGLKVSSTAAGTTGRLLYVTSATTGASVNGIVQVEGTGDHTGGLIHFDSVTTAGRVLDINTTALTTGTALNVSAAGGTFNSTLGLVRVRNNTASTTGILARFQSNTADANSGLTILANGNIGADTVLPKATIHNAGGIVQGMTTHGDYAAGGSIGTAATTVDVFSGIVITQTTAGQTVTVPDPTDVTAGRTFTLIDAFASTQGLTVTANAGGLSVACTPGRNIRFVWDGADWTANV